MHHHARVHPRHHAGHAPFRITVTEAAHVWRHGRRETVWRERVQSISWGALLWRYNWVMARVGWPSRPPAGVHFARRKRPHRVDKG